ncbi:hypothetical protein B879_03491 [Cecembia lonarensis LW9]|uniref:Uncharacterized protein n=2 Tax=Cecembia TaxID=1187078 RepID=K1LC19_CECL9|nr:hypothetical protein B879_03491 [Cecembia lonarensis LW9]
MLYSKMLWAISLIAVFFFFMRCNSKDLEFIQPYQFIVADFEDTPNLEEVIEEEPEVEEAVEATVVVPEAPSAIINDLENAESDEDVDRESVEVLTKVTDFVETEVEDEEKQAAVSTAVDNITEESVEEFLQEDAEVDEDILAVAIGAAESVDLGDLFPDLDLPDLPDDVDLGEEGRFEFDAISEIEFDLEQFRVNTLVGPCADAARNAFDVALSNLNTQRDNNLNTVTQNFNRRVTDANDRLTSRNQVALTNFRNGLRGLNEFIVSNLRAASSIERFNPRLARNLRNFTVLYMHYFRFILDRQYRFNLESIQRQRNIEVANAQVLRNNSISSINASYNAAVTSLNNTLSNALNNCHNQGTGN